MSASPSPGCLKLLLRLRVETRNFAPHQQIKRAVGFLKQSRNEHPACRHSFVVQRARRKVRVRFVPLFRRRIHFDSLSKPIKFLRATNAGLGEKSRRTMPKLASALASSFGNSFKNSYVKVRLMPALKYSAKWRGKYLAPTSSEIPGCTPPMVKFALSRCDTPIPSQRWVSKPCPALEVAPRF